MSGTTLPSLPAAHDELIRYIADHPDTPLVDLFKPYREYEAVLRQLYAQDAGNDVLKARDLNTLPLFPHESPGIQIRARDLEVESEQQKQQYIMTLPDDQRRANASPAVVTSFKEFQHNFNLFSESSLAELDWSNVVAAGSSVANCILPVPDKYNASKRTLREFYHEKFCPASDVDLFLYGLTEQEAIDKIRHIEAAVRNAILTETTTVRTKNALTIASQYPTRHIQIVLRLYQDVSEILSGFDVDCSAAAYDGKQVHCTPRALQSYITQVNQIDLSRRSPSYENRLSKYSHRGFEVHWPNLDRSRIDPTIFERSFQRTLGLARLLVLERLPTSSSRDLYLAKRREERGRPPLFRGYTRRLGGNVKDLHEDEVAEWVDADDVSNYHSFTIPYGVKFHAKKIEKLCYTRDLLLNAEWNQPKEREVYLHRHPAFFGRVDDIVGDCCGSCPKPVTDEEKAMYEEESRIYVSGRISFIKDDPGRQLIGSFHPLTAADWTDMAYVGNTARLCQDIVDGELENVQDWLSQDGADPNTRDYTGRTPLHLAVMQSTPDIVKALVDHGARLVARLADGRTALHLAAERGNVNIVRILMDKSAANEAEEEEKQAQKVKHSNAGAEPTEREDGESSEGSDVDMVDDAESDDEDQRTASSFVKVRNVDTPPEEDDDDPDFYDVSVVAWDSPCSALHFAIVCGHEEVVKLLCQEYGADVLLPIKFSGPDKQPTSAILTLVLAAKLPVEKAKSMVKTLLDLGATCAQADMHGDTAYSRIVQDNAVEIIELLGNLDQIGVKNSINHIAITSWGSSTLWPLKQAIQNGDPRLALQLLDAGALSHLDFETWLKAAKQSCIERQLHQGLDNNIKIFGRAIEQPIVLALQCADPSIALELIKREADVNSMTIQSRQMLESNWRGYKGETVLDLARDQIQRLRQYESPTATPLELKHGMDETLSKFEQGTWQHAAVKTAGNLAKRNNQLRLKDHEKGKAHVANRTGLQMKQTAIESAVAVLEKIEKAILAKGGKTFKELHPDHKYHEDQRIPWTPPKEVLEFTADFSIRGVSDVTEKRKAKYIELFEAAWMGDLKKIKALTLVSWDPENSEPPLQIAVQICVDNAPNKTTCTPFSLAYFRGHHNVASAIMEIAQAQYAPEEQPATRYHMHTTDDASECDDDDSEDYQPRIYSHIVDDHFTNENIGQVSMQVKSSVKPLDMLGSWATSSIALGKDQAAELTVNSTFLEHAIDNNDRKALKYYFDLIVHLGASQDKDDASGQIVVFPQRAFLLALEHGHVEMLADMVGWTGAGLPLEQLVKKTGVELKEISRYYAGLTVYGTKRKDWATAGRQVVAQPADKSITPPLLYAAGKGTIESVGWLLSDIPPRLYLEFGKSDIAKADVRFKHLSQSPGGFEGAVTKWLGTQNHLVMHAAIMGRNGKRVEHLLEYLIKARPAYLEAKNTEGLTPLALAAQLGRLNLIKILIAHGADQSVKDKQWNNIVHLALTHAPKASQLRQFLDLLDPKLRPFLLKERSGLQDSDGRTALHRWAGSGIQHPINDVLEELQVLLEHSEGEDLVVLDGQGDTVLHTLIRNKRQPALVREIIQANPKLLFRENAVGLTPAELAHDMYVHRLVEDPQKYGQRFGQWTRSIADTLLQKTPESFEQQSRGSDEPENITFGRYGTTDFLPRLREIYSVVNELAARYPSARRLVSLNEANDVAQRIGATYQSQRYAWEGFGDKKRREKTRRRMGTPRGTGGGHRLRRDELEDEEVDSNEDADVRDYVSNLVAALGEHAWEQPDMAEGA